MKHTFTLVLLFLMVGTTFSQNKTFTHDGAWCWFSAPRAIYLHGENKHQMMTGWVTEDGSIEYSLFHTQTEQYKNRVVAKALDKDDHANPSFLELANSNVLMTYTKHMDWVVRINEISVEDGIPCNVNEQKHSILDEEQLKLYSRKCVTYANPFQLREENNRIYCFGRWTGFKPNMMWSDDNGKTFTKSKVFITNKPFDGGNRPYVRYHSDGKSKIHIVFTDGHPRVEKNNSVYYAYYENGAFYRADDSKICSLEEIPFEPKDATCLYKASEKTGRAWVHDVTSTKSGKPVILYARYPSEQQHLYHYAELTKQGAWIDHQICDAGKWFPQTQKGKKEREPHYSGGMTFNPANPSEIYVSRTINGVFEIEQCVTKNHGKTWKTTPITQNSEYDNVRPVFPKNFKKGDKPMLLWMVNEKYVHYKIYKTRIDYKML